MFVCFVRCYLCYFHFLSLSSSPAAVVAVADADADADAVASDVAAAAASTVAVAPPSELLLHHLKCCSSLLMLQQCPMSNYPLFLLHFQLKSFLSPFDQIVSCAFQPRESSVSACLVARSWSSC